AARIREVVDDAYTLVSGVARVTPTTLDDDYASILKKADDAFQLVKGRPLTPAERHVAGAQILANHADPALPNLSPPADGNSLAATATRLLEGASAARPLQPAT